MSVTEIKIGSLLTKDEFRELTASDDRIAYTHLVLRLGIHAGLLFAMVRAWEGGYPALAFAAFYLNAVLWQFAGYAGIGHELFHKKVFSRKWLNTLFFKLFSYVTWNNPSYFEKSHQFHHTSTFHEDDSEIYRDFPLDLLGAARLILLDYQSLCRRIVYALCNALGYEAYFGRGIRLKAMPAERGGAQTDAVYMVLLNVVWLGLFLLMTRSPALTLMLFITPFVGQLPNRVLALAQHVGLEDHKDESALLFSRTVNLPAPVAFFYANMNYHAEHHLLPSVPYYNLPKLHDILNAKLKTEREEKEFSYLFTRDFWSSVGTSARLEVDAVTE
ncbi:fatty acid desaturase family protein [Rhizobium sullae]|uniref:fatty acid desaturase family protein n=1 Tax=Rhizobium sullae TaxID=50338 RepID=UPI000B34DDCB|nr:fatty acid desaturase [Rhizobium sullae]